MACSVRVGNPPTFGLLQRAAVLCRGSFFVLIKAKTDILGHKISRQQDMGWIVKKLEKTGNFALFGGIDFKQIIRYDLCHKVGGNPNPVLNTLKCQGGRKRWKINAFCLLICPSKCCMWRAFEFSQFKNFSTVYLMFSDNIACDLAHH
jgi:hypothetical protein